MTFDGSERQTKSIRNFQMCEVIVKRQTHNLLRYGGELTEFLPEHQPVDDRVGLRGLPRQRHKCCVRGDGLSRPSAPRPRFMGIGECMPADTYKPGGQASLVGLKTLTAPPRRDKNLLGYVFRVAKVTE